MSEIIDDGKYKWEEVYEALKNKFLKEIMKMEFKEREEYEYGLKHMSMFRDFIKDTIHNKLIKHRDLEKGIDENERNIREIVKFAIGKILPFVNIRLLELNEKLRLSKNEDMELLMLNKNYLDMEDDFYAIASYRSLIHFAHYMERQDDSSQLVWKYNMKDTMGSIFFYSNQMILDYKYQSLIKQCPTGYGKSKSDCVIISFCFGYDSNDDIGKWVGNPKLISVNTNGIVNMLLSKRFGKVFPEFGKYNGVKEDMFKKCAIGEGTFTLKGSKKDISFGCYNKLTDTNGLRFNKQFFDDITQMQDAEKVEIHKNDIATYEGEWKKRMYDEFKVLRWFTGTAYHREDFLSYIRKTYANNRPLVFDDGTKMYKWNRYVRLNENKNCVYISIPKLADLDLGEEKCYSTFPQKYSKVEALKALHGSSESMRRFYAMEQQQPMPPESMRFDHAFFKHYDKLPDDIVNKNCYTYVIIDPNRKGKDNYAGLVFKEPVNDLGTYYFVDCYYRKVSSMIAIPNICEKAYKHNADYIIFEENTTDFDLFKEKVETEMSKYSNFEYKLESIFSVTNKEVKINNNSDFILTNIILPQQGMFYEDSDMGRAIADIVNYTFENNKRNDDSIDCCAMLGDYKSKHNENVVEILNNIYF